MKGLGLWFCRAFFVVVYSKKEGLFCCCQTMVV